MRTLPLFLGLLGLVAAQASQAKSYVFSTTVTGSTAPINVATLDITQQGTSTLFQLTPASDFSTLGSNAYISTFSASYYSPAKIKSVISFPSVLPVGNVQPSADKFSSGFKKNTQDYVNTWNLNWTKQQPLGSAQTSTWIASNSTANLFGSSFYMKIQGLAGSTKPLKLTQLNAAPVPEVSNLSMYVTGLGLVGLVMLRRRGGRHSTTR